MHTLAPNLMRVLRSSTPRTSRGVNSRSRPFPDSRPEVRFNSSNTRPSPEKPSTETQNQISKSTVPSPSSPTPRTPTSPQTPTSSPTSPSRPSPPTTSSRLLALLLSPAHYYTHAQNRRPYLTQIATSVVIYFFGDLLTQYVRQPSSGPSSQSPTQTSSPASSPSPSFFTTTYDPTRSLRNILIGAISSIPSYRWFLYLGTLCNYPGHAVLSLGGKVVINQVLFAPIFNSYFFGMQSLLAGMIPSPTQSHSLSPISGEPSSSTASSVASSSTSTLPSPPTASSPPAPQAPASLLVDPALALKEAGIRARDTVPTSWYNSCLFWPFVTAFNYRFVVPRNRSAFAGLVAVGWQTWLGMLNQRAAEKERGRLEGLEREVEGMEGV